MKVINTIIIIFILSQSFNLYGQGPADDEEMTDYIEDLGDFDISNTVDLADPLYNDFFTNQCPTLKSAAARTNFVNYDQCNTTGSYNGKTTKYGNNCNSCLSMHYKGYHEGESQCYICDIGCAQTVLAMVLRNSGFYNDVTPATLQTWMEDDDNKGFNGSCSVDWELINRYPDATNAKMKLVGYIKPSESLDRARDIIKNGGFASIKVNANVVNKNTGKITVVQHHMILYDYIGDGTSANEEDFVVSDPASCKENSLSPRKVLSDYFTGSYPSARFYYTGVVTTGEYKSKLYSPKGSAKASFTIKDKLTDAEMDYYFRAIIRTLAKLHRIDDLKSSPLKSADAYCKHLWVITDPLGVKTAYTVNDFDYTFTMVGNYSISLIVQNADGYDVEVKNITVIDESIADFTHQPDNTALLKIKFTDKSIPADQIVSWYWDFGDGSTSSLQNPSHTYSSEGDYDVTLTVIFQNSEVRTITKTVAVENVSPMTVDFYNGSNPGSYVIEPDKLVQFISTVNNASGFALYTWDFGDGSLTSTLPHPTYIYTEPGVYTVTLNVRDNVGSKTVSHTFNVSQTGTVNASFTASTTAGSKEVTFTLMANTPVNAKLFFSDGTESSVYWVSPSLSPTLTHFYSRPGTFTVQMRIWYKGEWTIAFQKDVKIDGPAPSPFVEFRWHDCYSYYPAPWVEGYVIDIPGWLPPEGRGKISDDSPSETERGDPYYHEYHWYADVDGQPLVNFFSHGYEPYQRLNINDPLVQSKFKQNLPFTCNIQLRVYDVNNMTYDYSAEITLYPPTKVITEVKSVYTGCENASLAIAPVITGGSPPYYYSWRGDGSYSNDPTFVVSVGNQPKSYSISIVDSRRNTTCPYLYEKAFTVSPSALIVNAGDDVKICGTNTKGQLNATASGGGGLFTYHWEPNFDLSSANLNNPYVVSATSGVTEYTLTATDQYGCSNFDKVNVNVIENVIVNLEPTVFLSCGESKTISPSISGGSGNYSYKWSDGTTTKDIIVKESSNLSYSLTVTDNISGCSSSASTKILSLCSTITSTSSYARGKHSYNITIPITSSPGNISYTARTNCSWLTITSGSKGYSGDKLILNVAENNSSGERNGKLIIESPEALNSPFEIAITQTIYEPLNVPNEYASIQAAINAAPNDGLVEVDEGTYVENIVFSGTKKVSVKATGCPENTIINAKDKYQPIVMFENKNTSTLQGFTVAGNGLILGRLGENYKFSITVGAGIYIHDSSPELFDLIVSNNKANWAGGIASYGGSPKLVNVKIINNLSYLGGGMFIMSGSCTLQNVLIASNEVWEFYGSGIEGQGGGLAVAGNAVLDNVTIRNNNYPVINSRDGGLSFLSHSQIIKNSIITDRIGTGQTLPINISYSDITQTISGPATVTWGDGNIKSDPLLNSDYSLKSGSPCINTGDPTKFNKDGSRCDMGYTGGKVYYDNIVQICNKGYAFSILNAYLNIAGSCNLSYSYGETENFKATKEIRLKPGFKGYEGSLLSFKIQRYYNAPFLYDERCQSFLKSVHSNFENNTNPDSFDDKEFDFSVFPNPTVDKVSIYIQNNPTDNNIEITNMYGIVIKKITLVKDHVDIDLSVFAQGSYIFKVYSGSKLKTKLVIKQ